MNHWDPRAEELLSRARAVERVPLDARARVHSSVMATVALSSAASVSALAPSALAKLPAAFKAASAILPNAVVAGGSGMVAYLAPVTIGVALGLSAVSPSAVVTAPSVTRPTPSAAIGRAPRVSAPTAKLVKELPSGSKESESSDAPDVSAPKAPMSAASLADEADWLERARLVLRQGDAELALRLLDRYRRHYPKGKLFYEATATRAAALCQLGRLDEGRQILARLEETTPGLGNLAQVQRSCALRGQGEP